MPKPAIAPRRAKACHAPVILRFYSLPVHPFGNSMRLLPRSLPRSVFPFGTASIALAAMAMLAACSNSSTPGIIPGTTSQLTLMETTDIHSNVMSYDYFKLAEDKSIGLERTAALIKAMRAASANSMLFDNGDTIQGTALSDYQALVNPIDCGTTMAVYKVMNTLQYDAGGIGNHEFNFGLPFLGQVTGNQFQVDGVTAPAKCAGPNFPQVLANVMSSKTRAPLMQPYVILERSFTAVDPNGTTIKVPVKVGVIAFTPPAILNWDKRFLDGKVYTDGIRETATKYVTEMRAKGADIVVAISHGGLDNSPYSPSMENGNYYLSQVPGIDAMLLGHSHQIFPDAASTQPQFNLPGVDKVKGLVNGVPTVMANLWGKHLGVIKLSLRWDGFHWVVDTSKTVTQAVPIKNTDGSFVTPDASIAPLVATEHQATINYVKTPVGTTNFNMASYFADVGDVTAIQVVNQAQADYVSNYVKANLPQFASLPVLSVSAPFKSGFAGGNDYTDVAAGNVAINNAADLYLFPNTVYAVKVNGAEIKAWLETAAARFNKIDPNLAAPQELISTFPGFNFDVFTSADMQYEIDVTQALNSRIKNLMYKGAPISPTQEFIVATNNYRASGGGNFPGLDGSKTIYASPDANRDVLISYIKAQKNLSLASNGSTRSWRFTKVTTAGPVTFKSAQGKLPLAQAAGLSQISLRTADDGSGKGLSVYAIDLSK
jgi:2',3'-cyclic-nucleotide 2'-phosphodiesterase/3'-nucleotidase